MIKYFAFGILILLTAGCTNANLPLSLSSNVNSSIGGGRALAVVSWSAVTGQQTGFYVDVSENGTDFISYATVPDGTFTVTVKGLLESRTYYVRVTAFSEGGSSQPVTVSVVAN